MWWECSNVQTCVVELCKRGHWCGEPTEITLHIRLFEPHATQLHSIKRNRNSIGNGRSRVIRFFCENTSNICHHPSFLSRLLCHLFSFILRKEWTQTDYCGSMTEYCISKDKTSSTEFCQIVFHTKLLSLRTYIRTSFPSSSLGIIVQTEIQIRRSRERGCECVRECGSAEIVFLCALIASLHCAHWY